MTCCGLYVKNLKKMCFFNCRSEADSKLQNSLAGVITAAIKPRTGHKRIPLVHVNFLTAAAEYVTGIFDAILSREMKVLCVLAVVTLHSMLKSELYCHGGALDCNLSSFSSGIFTQSGKLRILTLIILNSIMII